MDKTKISSLRKQRVLNRYFFFQQELDLKENMLEEMDIDFREAVNNFLKENPEFNKIYQERIQQKQEEAFRRYKEEFAEETGEVLSDSKDIVLSENKEPDDIKEPQEESEDNQSEEEIHTEKKDPKKEEKKIYQKLYREIVKVTHPDKIKDDQRNRMYIRATNAYENSEYLLLVMIANQLNINWDLNPGMEKNVKITVEMLQQKLVLIEKSVSWLWYNTENNDVKNHLLITFLKNNLM